jgi:hypothetical protein
MMKKILLTAVALLWASAANAFIMNGEFNANSYVHTLQVIQPPAR